MPIPAEPILPYRLTIEIPQLPKSVNQQMSMHWAQKGEMVKQWHLWVLACVGNNRPTRPLEKAHLTCTRFSSQPPDYDNLAGSFKPVIDGLVKCGVLLDDSLKIIGMPDFKWVKSKRRDGKIQITVRQLD